MNTDRTLSLDAFQRETTRLWGAITPMWPTPMLGEIWARACAIALNPDGAFEMIVAEDETENPSAAAAFDRRRAWLIPRLFLLGAEELWEPADVLYRDERGARALAAAVARRGEPIRFGHFPAASPFVPALKDACRGKALVIADPVAGSPYISLHAGWRDPMSQFSSRRKGDLRRMRRKAEAMGAVTFEVLTPDPKDVDAIIEEATMVEAEGWKGRSGSALAFDDKARAFFEVYARLASEAGVLRVSFLRIDAKPAATQIAVECDNAFWLLKIGYNEVYKDCSPGNLLLLETVRHAAERGLASFEFLGKSAPWTAVWTNDERANIRLRTYPRNLAGGVAIVLDAFTAGARRARAFAASRMRRDHAKSD